MKSFVETFMDENMDALYCAVCLESEGFRCKECKQEFVAFKEFDAASQLEIMKKELDHAYNS